MEREQVAALLAGAEGYLSGEEMSRALGVTRAAVWKEIEALREAGWPIQSSTRKGYRLAGPPPVLSAAYISAMLPPGNLFAGKVLVEPLVDSTNTRLKTMAAAGAPTGAALLAEEQSGGRGARIDPATGSAYPDGLGGRGRPGGCGGGQRGPGGHQMAQRPVSER